MGDLKTAAFGDRRNAKQTLIEALDFADGAKAAVVVLIHEDDTVAASWSDSSMLTRVGMCDVAKLQMIDAAYEVDDS